MIEGKALEQIQRMILAASDVEGTDFGTKLVPENMKLASLEEFNAQRNRFRGLMKTSSLVGFTTYVRDHGAGNASCFIDASDMSASAVFNMGTVEAPGHADDTAVLKLEKTAPYKAMLNVDGTPMTQKAMAEWLEDWRENMTAIDEDGADMEMKKAIAAIRRVTIEAKHSSEHEERNFGANRSAMEQIEAKGKDGALPKSFCFECVPFEGLDSRQFYLRLSLITGDAPKFTLRIIQQEKNEEDVAAEFRDLLIVAFNSEVSTYVGSFKA